VAAVVWAARARHPEQTSTLTATRLALPEVPSVLPAPTPSRWPPTFGPTGGRTQPRPVGWAASEQGMTLASATLGWRGAGLGHSTGYHEAPGPSGRSCGSNSSSATPYTQYGTQHPNPTSPHGRGRAGRSAPRCPRRSSSPTPSPSCSSTTVGVVDCSVNRNESRSASSAPVRSGLGRPRSAGCAALRGVGHLPRRRFRKAVRLAGPAVGGSDHRLHRDARRSKLSLGL
jgi:hypothetical protein